MPVVLVLVHARHDFGVVGGLVGWVGALSVETIDYGYYWWRHHKDGSTFIACRDEGDGQWYMPGLGHAIDRPERHATLLGPVPRHVAGGGSIDQ